MIVTSAQRARVIEELVETERKYCACLWTLLDHFAARLRDSGVIAAKDVKSVQQTETIIQAL